MILVLLLGRILFSAIFILASFNHFSHQLVNYAASQGVPYPVILVPIAGIIALLGGLSILLGFKARFGALLIMVFLVPVTLVMHRFWDASGSEAQLQQIMFMKNLSMLGGALLIAYFGSGPLSLKK